MAKIIEYAQGSPEWLAWRRKGITATDIATILGVNPYSSINELREKKNGKECVVSPAMKRGSQYEEEARQCACYILNLDVHPACLESERNHLFRASLDGWDGQTVVEIKVPTKRNFKTFFDKEVNLQLYAWQVRWQMMVAGAQEGVLFAYEPSTSAHNYIHIVLTGHEIELMEREAMEFWDCYQMGLPFSPVSWEKDLYHSQIYLL